MNIRAKEIQCPSCNGKGYTIDFSKKPGTNDTCHTCNGTGFVLPTINLDAKPTALSSVSNDAKLRRLEEPLLEALESVRTGKWKDFDGVLVLAVKNKNKKYNHGYTRAGLHHSDCICLLEVTKNFMLNEMFDDE